MTPGRSTIGITLLTVLLAGCTPRIILEETDGDRLRAHAVELEDKVRRLEQRNRELEAELAHETAAAPGETDEVRAATPHVVEIALGRLSHARDATGDGAADELILYVRPGDGLGRFVQLVGTLSINAAILPAGADAVTIGRSELSPLQVRDAYRSGLTGTHYTVTLPIERPAGGQTSCVVRIVYSDAASGRTVAGERTVSLRP